VTKSCCLVLSIFMKIIQWENSYPMWTDRRTGTKLIVTFGNFAKARINSVDVI